MHSDVFYNANSVVFYNGGWWIVLAIVTAGLAETKGRSRWNWLLLGLLLGPLATVLVVAWPRPEVVAKQAAETADRGAPRTRRFARKFSWMFSRSH